MNEVKSTRKSAMAAQVIQKRIAHADHALAGGQLPSERQLAEELGISRITVRAAFRQLVETGVLVRQSNGRLDLSENARLLSKKTIGFGTPANSSDDYNRWHEGVAAALEGHSVTLRPISYAHWGDPALPEALAGFDGLFLIPPAEKVPAWLTAKIAQAESCRVVVLDQDESDSGIPSVTMFPLASERKLMDHLHLRCGHKRIDCLNTQAEDGVIQGRIRVWSEYIREKGIPGQLRSRPGGRPLELAYQVVKQALQEGRPLASALFCTTGPAAIGAMRALHESGFEIGKAVSVCAVNDEGVGRYLLRSLTALESPPRAAYLRGAVDWMLRESDWTGPMLVQPKDVPLFEGESTGPAPDSPVLVMR